ncbi:MAG: NHL repeat-containing protein [Verrucomicrobiota bacterium]|nr:NHL repeat-containing protein [Verrucomicrobiota bacterium]
MLALLYLALAIYLGDQLSRRFFRFVTVAQRCATAVIVGLLLSTWFTYMASWLFRATTRPLLWGDICFFAAAAAIIWKIRRRARRGIAAEVEFISPRVSGSGFWDWITILAFLVFASWMMFATLNYKDGTLLIGNNEWSDFGPNTAIIQSFAVGHNFPTHYPHFSGEPIRYHFLFYFQAGNLTFLGLPLAWSLNFLSIITLVSLLALLMALGQSLFQSRAVGRIGAALFFFHGTLSFVSFFRSQSSFSSAWHAIFGLKDFLASGYPYRGEMWGIWTQVVYLNQRHFASAVCLLAIVLLFLIDRYRRHYQERAASPATAPIPTAELSPAAEPEFPEPDFSLAPPVVVQPEIRWSDRLRALPGKLVVFDKSFVFAGCLLGLLPFWNALVFTAAFAILSILFLLFPCRRQMVGLGLAAALAALPQLALLQAGGAQTATHSLLHWGYVIGPPTIGNIFRYLAFSFGLKWGLILPALLFANWFQRRFFLALCSMYVMTLGLQMSIETLANHKYLNVWLIISNLFAAYGIWRLWRIRGQWFRWAIRPITALVTGAIVLGGAIDLVPIHNCYWIQLKYERDPLVTWLRQNTKPHDIFLSDRFVNHQILLAGRRLFYGWPSFPWSSGYDTTQRDRDYLALFESTDPYAVFRLLYKHNIAYVAIDDSIRHNHEAIKRPNEELYRLNFPKVWEDTANQYGKLTIYKVPHPPPADIKRSDPAHLQAMLLRIPPVTMFQGGKGSARGQFDSPRGLTIDLSGNILVSDSNNSRIQKFSPAGAFLGIIGQPGSGPNGLGAPDGIAVDKDGFIYVADAANQNVRKLAGNGDSIAQWQGPQPGFYGPRDVAVGPENSIYVVDQGRTRVVRFRSDGSTLQVWGSAGKGDGQFSDPSSVAVDERNNRIYVADPGNQRIQVFDLDGKFIMKWLVEEWRPSSWAVQHLAIDQRAGYLYASSFTTNEVLVFDLAGKKLRSLQPKAPDTFDGPSALALLNGKLYVLNTPANRVSVIDVEGRP